MSSEKQKEVLLPLLYLPPTRWWAEFFQADKVVLEKKENFVKQSLRNRCAIYGANGKLMLIAAVSHENKSRLYTDTEICNAEDWKTLHFRSVKTAYQSSAYYEFYEHKIEQIWKNDTTNLWDFNLNALQIILDILKQEVLLEYTSTYEKEPCSKDKRSDYKGAYHAAEKEEPYFQVFEHKYGFIPDLSILDLLFNLGPEAISYLKKYPLS